MRRPRDSGEGTRLRRAVPAWHLGGAHRVCASGVIVVVSAGGVPAATSPLTADPSGVAAPTTLPAELDPTIQGKLEQSEAFLKADNYADAVRAAVGALRQAVDETRKTTPPTDESRAVLETVVSFTLRLADQAKKAGELGVAQHCYTQVRYVDSTRWEPVLGLADVNRMAGQILAASDLYEVYLGMKGRPLDHRGHLGKGLCNLAMGHFGSAEFNLRKAIRAAPLNAEAHMGLARALHGRQRAKQAVAPAETAIRLDQKAPEDERHREYPYYLAMILKDADQLDRALTVARQLSDSVRGELQGSPTNVELVNHLEKVLLLRYGLLETLSATEQGRRDPQIFVEMAQVLEDLGTIRQIKVYLNALELLAKAQALDPEKVDVLLRQARLYRLVGARDAVIAAYQAALQVSPGNEQAKTALREMGAPLAPPEPAPTSAPAPGSAPVSAPVSAPSAGGR